MGSTQTLYEVLGVAQGAGTAELRAAYRREAGALEASRSRMSPQSFNDRSQLLRMAMSTLVDPASRHGYDIKLAASRGTDLATEPMGLALVPLAPQPEAVANARADALSLRADALSLRADAMLLRAGVDAPASAAGEVARTVASGTMSALKYFVRAVGLLVLMGVLAFSLTRCMRGDPAARSTALETKANERTALQEYYQTHGMRPANMAELELLEAERRRRENQGRSEAQDREKAERDARRFDDDARQRAREVSENLRRSEEQARREALAEQARKQYEAQANRAAKEAEQRRIERQQNQWREILRN